jgi:hypothetical protein
MKQTKKNRKNRKKINKTNKFKKYFPNSHFYMFSKKLYKKNNKVIENITKEVNNNKISIKGYINGKKINKTKN